MWLNQDSLARSLTHAPSTPEVRIHIYPLTSISRATQNYCTPNPGENSQKDYPIPIIPYEINAQVILVTTTCYIILGDECSKKREKEYEKIKRGKCPEPQRKEKVRREVKMDKCPTVELGVQDTHLREKKKKNIEHLILHKKLQSAIEVCIS